MRVIFVNRFFFPDHSATSQMLSDLAFALAGEGMEIHVVTSRMRYDAPADELPAYETVREVSIHRVRTSRFGRTSIAGRIVDYGSFYAAASRQLLAVCQPGDIVVAKTDPPLIGLACHAVARNRGAHLVNWQQDLYPETAANMGVPLVKSMMEPALRRLRNNSLKAAVANVAVGDIMGRRLTVASGRPETTHVIPNWSDCELIRPVPPTQNTLRHDWGLTEKFVVAYSGNLGRAHEFDTLLSAAQLLSAQTDLKFLFIGGGRGSQHLKMAVASRGLDQMFQFRPYQPMERLSESLSVGDVHWLSLLPQFEGLIVPSKVYGIMAAGRPVIAVCDPEGELAPLVAREGIGVPVRPGDGQALASAIRLLRDNVDARTAMGERGRHLVETTLSRQASIAAWSRLLTTIGD